MERVDFDKYFIIRSIARRAAAIHESVNQHYDIHPYSYHLNMVADIAAKYLLDIVKSEEDIVPVMFGAYFHDTIEDARLTYHDVQKIASEFMTSLDEVFLASDIVYALTNEKGKNRAERANEKYYQGIRETPYASFVKVCDRLANYTYAKQTKSKMVACYEKEVEEFINNVLVLKHEDKRFVVPEELIRELVSKD